MQYWSLEGAHTEDLQLILKSPQTFQKLNDNFACHQPNKDLIHFHPPSGFAAMAFFHLAGTEPPWLSRNINTTNTSRGAYKTEGNDSYLIHKLLQCGKTRFSDTLWPGSSTQAALENLLCLPGNDSKGKTQQPPRAHTRQEVAALAG